MKTGGRAQTYKQLRHNSCSQHSTSRSNLYIGKGRDSYTWMTSGLESDTRGSMAGRLFLCTEISTFLSSDIELLREWVSTIIWEDGTGWVLSLVSNLLSCWGKVIMHVCMPVVGAIWWRPPCGRGLSVSTGILSARGVEGILSLSASLVPTDNRPSAELARLKWETVSGNTVPATCDLTTRFPQLLLRTSFACDEMALPPSSLICGRGDPSDGHTESNRLWRLRSVLILRGRVSVRLISA